MSTSHVLLAALTLGAAFDLHAQGCTPIASGLPSAPLVLPAQHARLSHTEQATIDVPIEIFRAWFFKAPLEQLLPGTKDIPAVTGTAQVGPLTFPQAGATRYVCLADGNGAVEQVIGLVPERFSYLVWGYTLPEAQALSYGHGQFEFSAAGDQTHLRWTYSFLLKEDRLPGSLGPVGRFLFRVSFLDSKYADFMRSGMQAIKRGAETAAGARLSQ